MLVLERREGDTLYQKHDQCREKDTSLWVRERFRVDWQRLKPERPGLKEPGQARSRGSRVES